jgi:hypothetical protein
MGRLQKDRPVRVAWRINKKSWSKIHYVGDIRVALVDIAGGRRAMSFVTQTKCGKPVKSSRSHYGEFIGPLADGPCEFCVAENEK